jgi:hypothetical protein
MVRTWMIGALAWALLQAPGAHGPSAPVAGQMAPEIRLNDQSGQAQRLAPPKPGETGVWTVLAFFPKAATPG